MIVTLIPLERHKLARTRPGLAFRGHVLWNEMVEEGVPAAFEMFRLPRGGMEIEVRALSNVVPDRTHSSSSIFSQAEIDQAPDPGIFLRHKLELVLINIRSALEGTPP